MRTIENASAHAQQDAVTFLADRTIDYIIVGGGSAGCVLASRLSAQPGKTVALIESGLDWTNSPDGARIREPNTRTVFAPAFYWPDAWAEITAAKSADQPARIGMAMLARALGGGSIVNGLQAGRGLPRDYDEWEQSGVLGWSWDDVLPYFKKVECDLDFRGEVHGQNGPIHIQRVPEQRWSRLSLSLRTALESSGIARAADFNDPGTGNGVGAVPLNFGESGRMSTASCYLTPEVRQRANLKIVTGAHVERVVFQGVRATGVKCKTDLGEHIFRATEVILSCGAINSPALLQRSGVGPREVLSTAGVAVVADRSGVGKNLQNHPILSVNVHLRAVGRRRSSELPPCVMVARYSSGEPACADSDMFINVWERLLSSQRSVAFSQQMADLMLQLNKSYSRGEVRIKPGNISALPDVRFNLLSDDRDRARMEKGTLFITKLLRHPDVAPLVNDTFISKLTPQNIRLLMDTRSGRFFSTLAAVALKGPAPLRRRLMQDATISMQSAAAVPSEVSRLVDENVLPAGHSVGTCRMGAQNDPRSVTDSRCKVIGCEGLRVVDASIFPTIMTAGTNLPVMMAAEKAAAMIAEDSR